MSKSSFSQHKALAFITLCCLVYFASYITRINYAAAISEIVISLNISNQLASMAVTGSFVAYGAGQLVNGFLGDHIKPRQTIFVGLAATSVCNLCMSYMNNIYIMTALWCLNGFFQSMLWPPLVRIMAEVLSDDEYQRACVWVSAAASIATIVVYLLIPFCILISGWRLAFIIPAGFGLLITFVWFFNIEKFTKSTTSVNAESNLNPTYIKKSSLMVIFGLIPIMLVIVLQGMLRDGITTWMPTYINNVYHFGTSISITSTAILPVFSILSVTATSFVGQKVKSEIKAATYIFGAGLVATIIFILVFESSAWASVLLMAIITGCMHGVNLMLVSRLPAHFIKYGRVSTVSGILNAFTYVGSAISAYGIAALSENFGWKITILSWIMIALLGTSICALCINKWNRFISTGDCRPCQNKS